MTPLDNLRYLTFGAVANLLRLGCDPVGEGAGYTTHTAHPSLFPGDVYVSMISASSSSCIEAEATALLIDRRT